MKGSYVDASGRRYDRETIDQLEPYKDRNGITRWRPVSPFAIWPEDGFFVVRRRSTGVAVRHGKYKTLAEAQERAQRLTNGDIKL